MKRFSFLVLTLAFLTSCKEDLKISSPKKITASQLIKLDTIVLNADPASNSANIEKDSSIEIPALGSCLEFSKESKAVVFYNKRTKQYDCAFFDWSLTSLVLPPAMWTYIYPDELSSDGLSYKEVKIVSLSVLDKVFEFKVSRITEGKIEESTTTCIPQEISEIGLNLHSNDEVCESVSYPELRGLEYFEPEFYRMLIQNTYYRN